MSFPNPNDPNQGQYPQQGFPNMQGIPGFDGNFGGQGGGFQQPQFDFNQLNPAFMQQMASAQQYNQGQMGGAPGYPTQGMDFQGMNQGINPELFQNMQQQYSQQQNYQEGGQFQNPDFSQFMPQQTPGGNGGPDLSQLFSSMGGQMGQGTGGGSSEFTDLFKSLSQRQGMDQSGFTFSQPNTSGGSGYGSLSPDILSAMSAGNRAGQGTSSSQFEHNLNDNPARNIPDKTVDDSPIEGDNGIYVDTDEDPEGKKTSFFNSGLQCILHSMPLVRYFLSDEWENELQDHDEDELVSTLTYIIKGMWQDCEIDEETQKHSLLNPELLLLTLREKFEQLSEEKTPTPFEFVNYLIQGLHQEMERVKEPEEFSPIYSSDEDQDKVKEVFNETIEMHNKHSNSKIFDFFRGFLKVNYICTKCHDKFFQFKPFTSLDLPLKPDNKNKVRCMLVPWNWEEQTKEINLPINRNKYEQGDFELLLEEELQRSINIVICSRPITDNTFAYSVPKDISSSEIYLLELPNNYNPVTGYYVPCIIKTKILVADKDSERKVLKDISGPFLIEVSGQDASEDEVYQKVVEKIHCIWEDKDYGPERLPENIVNLKIDESSTLFAKEEFANYKIKVNIPSDYIRNPQPGQNLKRLTPSVQYENVSKKTVTIEINYNGTDVNKYSLLRHACLETRQAVEMFDPTITLRDLFNYFLEEYNTEEDQFECPLCKENAVMKKRMEIYEPPELLMIQIQRDSNDNKSESYIEIPDNFNMDDYKDNGQNFFGYRSPFHLYGSIDYSGSIADQHYVANCCIIHKEPSDDKTKYPKRLYRKFDGSNVTSANSNDVRSSSSNVLFYEKMEPYERPSFAIFGEEDSKEINQETEEVQSEENKMEDQPNEAEKPEEIEKPQEEAEEKPVESTEEEIENPDKPEEIEVETEPEAKQEDEKPAEESPKTDD